MSETGVVKGFKVFNPDWTCNGRPSELQKLNINRINTSGGIGVFLYPEGFDEFKNLVKGVIDCGIHIPALIALKNANASSKCVIFKE